MSKQLVTIVHQAPEKKDTTIKERVGLDLSRIPSLLCQKYEFSNTGHIWLDFFNLLKKFSFHIAIFDVLSK